MSIQRPDDVRRLRSGNTQPRRILDAAAELFARQGFRATTMKEIGAKCDFTHAAIYSYYTSKVSILVAIFDLVTEYFRNHLDEVIRDERPPADQLDRIIENHVTMLLDNWDYMTVFFREQTELPPGSAEEVTEILREYTAKVRQIIKLGVDRGDFRDTNPAVAANAILGMCNSTHQWYRHHPGALTPRETGTLLAQLVGDGYRATPAPS